MVMTLCMLAPIVLERNQFRAFAVWMWNTNIALKKKGFGGGGASIDKNIGVIVADAIEKPNSTQCFRAGIE